MPYNFNELCRIGGQLVNIPNVNSEALLWAIGGAESSHGELNVPRHESSYHMGGRYFEPKLYQKFGCMAHCSWGPWQIMFTNVWAISGGRVTPAEMENNHTAMLITVEWMNRKVIARGATTVSTIADAWNSGSHKDHIVPVHYIEIVEQLYERRLEEL